MRNAGVGLSILLLLLPTALQAQQSSEDLAQAAANPVANLMSFPFQYNADFGLGSHDRTRSVLNIQPVIPLAGGRIITRTIIPFVWMPDVTSESGSLFSGLSDILFTAFYVPEGTGSLFTGVGPVLEIPTGGETRGSQKWSVGPSAVLLAQPGDWTLGILANNVWSFAGSSDRSAVNKGLLQYFIVRQLGNGWYVNSAPSLTANWKAPKGQKYLVPFGLGGGKLAFFGKLPVNTQVAAFYNAVKPDIGPDWQFRVQLQVLLPVPGSR